MKPIKARICSAAREIFLREGPQGLSMRRIAEKVGVTPPAIYRHFKNKDELLDEVVGSGLGILESYLRPALENGDPYRSLKGLIDAYLDFALEQPKYFDLAFLLPSPAGRLSAEIRRHNRATFRFAVEQVGRCMEARIFSKADPLETSVMLWATAHGLVTFHRMQRLGLDERQFRRLYRKTIDRILAGLKPG
jgi:AcrR family transcriptional regulator